MGQPVRLPTPMVVLFRVAKGTREKRFGINGTARRVRVVNLERGSPLAAIEGRI